MPRPSPPVPRSVRGQPPAAGPPCSSTRVGRRRPRRCPRRTRPRSAAPLPDELRRTLGQVSHRLPRRRPPRRRRPGRRSHSAARSLPHRAGVDRQRDAGDVAGVVGGPGTAKALTHVGRTPTQSTGSSPPLGRPGRRRELLPGRRPAYRYEQPVHHVVLWIMSSVHTGSGSPLFTRPGTAPARSPAASASARPPRAWPRVVVGEDVFMGTYVFSPATELVSTIGPAAAAGPAGAGSRPCRSATPRSG